MSFFEYFPEGNLSFKNDKNVLLGIELVNISSCISNLEVQFQNYTMFMRDFTEF
jgi:hypothetical protein